MGSAVTHAERTRAPDKAQTAKTVAPAVTHTDPQIAANRRAIAEWEQTRRIETVRRMRADFESSDEARRWNGTRPLGSITDEELAAIQRTWRAHSSTGVDLYPYLLAKMSVTGSGAIAHALLLLRQGFARNPPMRTDFASIYQDGQVTAWIAREIQACFGRDRQRHGAGHAMLRGQSQKMLEAIAASFEAQFRIGIVDWLAANASRSQYAIRAIAILRNALDEPKASSAATELMPAVSMGAYLIDPDNKNTDKPVELLRNGGHAAALRLEADFDRTFSGIGPEPGKRMPSTLGGYLQRLNGWWEDKPFQEAMALLHHDLTEAEKLYFALHSWGKTRNGEAIEIMERVVKQGMSRWRLDRDWDKYVRGGVGGYTTAFTRDDLPWFIQKRFTLAANRTGERLLALYDSLDADNHVQAPAAPRSNDPAAREKHHIAVLEHEDAEAQRKEDTRLRAAEATIRTYQSAVMPNNDAIVAAIGSIRDIWQERIARLKARSEEVGSAEALGTEAREALAASYRRQVATAASTWRMVRTRMRRRLSNHSVFSAGETIWMSGDAALLAERTSVEEESIANTFYHFAQAGRWDKVEEAVTTAWAEGKINAFLAEAGREAKSDEGPTRPAFVPMRLLLAQRGSPHYRRIAALITPGATDGQRGATRIEQELADVANDGDLEGLLALLGHRAFKDHPAPRNDAVLVFASHIHFTRQLREAPGVTAETILLDHVQALIWRRGEETGPNFVKLSGLLVPPRTAAEQEAHARRQREAGASGVWRAAPKALAQSWVRVSGSKADEAEERGMEQLGLAVGATDQELKPALEQTGAADRDALAQQVADSTAALREARQTLESTCASLIAGAAEIAVETGLALVTGGAGLPAVLNSMLAAAANVGMTKAMLGNEARVVSTDNINSIVQSGLGTAMIELGLRNSVIALLPLKWEEKGTRASKYAQDAVHNVLTGMIEQTALSMTEIVANAIGKDKPPTPEDMAKQLDYLIGRVIAKLTSTHVTQDRNPQKVHSYLAAMPHVVNTMLFKLALKVTESGSKELVSALIKDDPNQTFSDIFVQVLWKDVKGIVGTSAKTGASILSARKTFDRERGLIESYRKKSPAEFSRKLNEAVLYLFHDEEKGPPLKAQYEEARRKQPNLTPHGFLLGRLAHPDTQAPGGNDKLRSQVHKLLLQDAEAAMGETVSQHALDRHRSGARLDAIAREELEADEAGRPPPGRASLVKQVRVLRDSLDFQAAYAAVDTLTLPQKLQLLPPARRERFGGGGTIGLNERLVPIWMDRLRTDPAGAPNHKVFEAVRRRLRATAVESAARTNDPRAVAEKFRLIAEVFRADSPRRRALQTGDIAEIARFIHEFGDWGTAISMLQAGGPGTAGIAEFMVLNRRVMANKLDELFGAKAAANAGARHLSDLDPSVMGDRSGRGLIAAEAHMNATAGKDPHHAYHSHLYLDPGYLTMHLPLLRRVDPQERARLHRDLTQHTETHVFAQMRAAAAGAPRGMEAFVGNVARAVGFDRMAEADDVAREFHPQRDRTALNSRLAALDDERAAIALLPEGTESETVAKARRMVAFSKRVTEAHAMMVEAHLGDGANLDTVESLTVAGPLAYRAVLSYLPMYMQHRVAPLGDRDADPAKYVVRIIGALNRAGVATPEMEPYLRVCAALKDARDVLGRRSLATADLAKMYEGFQALLPAALGRMRAVAEQTADVQAELTPQAKGKPGADLAQAVALAGLWQHLARQNPDDQILQAQLRVAEQIVAHLQARRGK